jgi:hypothetical protein
VFTPHFNPSDLRFICGSRFSRIIAYSSGRYDLVVRPVLTAGYA